jgi:hypothetical protein
MGSQFCMIPYRADSLPNSIYTASQLESALESGSAKEETVMKLSTDAVSMGAWHVCAPAGEQRNLVDRV